MEVIAQGVGISKPTLYKHFSSKLELYLAVLQIHLDILVAGVQAALRSTTDNAQRVHAAVQAYFDFTDQEDQGVRLVFASDLMVEPSVQWRVDRAFDACVQAVFDLLARDSGVDPRRVRVLAVGVVGASQLAARHWLESNRPIPKEVAVETTAALCWGGLSQIGRLGPMATAFGKVGHHAEPRATELD
jgi:AcrR family transcriptional regulator